MSGPRGCHIIWKVGQQVPRWLTQSMWNGSCVALSTGTNEGKICQECPTCPGRTWVIASWERYGENNVPSYEGVNFRNANLRNTSFILPNMPLFQPGLDLRRAWFLSARAEGAVFFNADLSRSTFAQAHLRGADFSGAVLDDVIFFEADLTGANLSATRPWRLRLVEGGRSEPVVSLLATRVQGVGDILEICRTLRRAHEDARQSGHFYYRGQSASWRLRPSVMRKLALRQTERRAAPSGVRQCWVYSRCAVLSWC